MSDYKTRFRERFEYRGNDYGCVLKEGGDAFTTSEILAFIDEVVAEVREEIVEERNEELYDIQQQELEDLAEAREQGRAEERDSIIKIVRDMKYYFHEEGCYFLEDRSYLPRHCTCGMTAHDQALDDLLLRLRGETWNTEPRKSNETPKVGVGFQEETECCENPVSSRVCERGMKSCTVSHKPRTEETPGHLVPLSSGTPDAKFFPHSKETEKEGASFSGREIPIEAAKHIADTYGYEQVVIIARKTGDNGNEHCTTYGVDKTHCDIAARMGDHLKFNVMGWERPKETTTPQSREQSGETYFCHCGKKVQKGRYHPKCVDELR